MSASWITRVFERNDRLELWQGAECTFSQPIAQIDDLYVDDSQIHITVAGQTRRFPRAGGIRLVRDFEVEETTS